MPTQPKQQPPYYSAQTKIKIYHAIITQTGTDAPTANILQNTLSGTPIWTRISDGQYNLTLTNEFTIGKTSVILTPGDIIADPYYLNWFSGGALSNDAIGIYTYVGTTPTDALLFESTILITIYP